ncbi:MAG TPA: hypothetical protein VFX60_00105 [Micromonospora sp.]|nr:hypothetical protein [Micromonospora sp.]
MNIARQSPGGLCPGSRHGTPSRLTPSQFAHEREALAHVQQLLPDTEPYRAWSNFTFTAQTGYSYEVDLLMATPGAPPDRDQELDRRSSPAAPTES